MASSLRQSRFVDTMQPPELRIRGRRAYSAPKADLRDTRRFDRRGRDEEAASLRRTAGQRFQQTTLHRTGQRNPTLRQTLRAETDKAVHDFAREKKALVYHLRRSSDAGGWESSHTHKTELGLLKALDQARRVVFLANSSVQKRAARSNDRFDTGDDLLVKEHTLATYCKEDLERQLALVKAHRQEMRQARDALATLIKTEKRALGLAGESYSGTVTDYPPPRGPVPEQVVRVDELCEEAAELRKGSAQLMAECTQQLTDMRIAIRHELKRAELRSKELERELVLSQGEARLAHNSAKRNAWVKEMQRERNEGPTSGQWLTTAERRNRPLVREYNKAVEHRRGVVTGWETSTAGFDTFSRSLRETQADEAQLGRTSKWLTDAKHDRAQTHAVDEEVQRFRRRLAPERRP